VEIRFYNDPLTAVPHIYEHGISESEVSEVLLGIGEDLPAKRNSRMKIGRNRSRPPEPELADPFGPRLRAETRLKLTHAFDHHA